MDYIERDYRELHRQDDLVHFQVAVKETDLDIGVRRDRYTPEFVSWVESLIRDCRTPLEDYIQRDPGFVSSLEPYDVLPGAPPLVQEMARVSRLAGVGPMAAVAGALSEWVGRAVARRSRDVIVENGGDIFLRSARIRRIGVFAGQSPLSNRLAIEIRPSQTPLGICTSSGTVGPSLSFGKADAVVILSPSAALADAAASAVGNVVQGEDDLQQALGLASQIPGVSGALIIKGDRLAAWGQVKLLPLKPQS